MLFIVCYTWKSGQQQRISLIRLILIYFAFANCQAVPPQVRQQKFKVNCTPFALKTKNLQLII